MEQASGAEADSELVEERGDLIQFYNSIYVVKMKTFALKYALPAADSRVCIYFSPLWKIQ